MLGQTKYRWHSPRLQRHWSFRPNGNVGSCSRGSLLAADRHRPGVSEATPTDSGSSDQSVDQGSPSKLPSPRQPSPRYPWRHGRHAPSRRNRPSNRPSIILDLLVKRGDTLEVLFRRNGLSLTDLAAMVALPAASSALKLLKPGDRLRSLIVTARWCRCAASSTTSSCWRSRDRTRALRPTRSSARWMYGPPAHMERSRVRCSKQALPPAYPIARRWTWQASSNGTSISFRTSAKETTFTVIYEELWRDGVKLRDGEIVAAEFVNQGKSFRAARFRDESGRAGYFTPEGRSVRKAFIRAPLNFTRISSNFNPSRRHPVLNTIRAHRGVDYAAPSGTPIRAAGDGKVLFRGVQGGYGNTIVLQHGGNITTLYGHLPASPAHAPARA